MCLLSTSETNPPVIDNRIDMAKDDETTVAFFAACIALLTAGLYYLARLGFDNPETNILKVLSISLLLLCLPSGYNILNRRLNLPATWYTSGAALTAYALGLIFVAGFGPKWVGINIFLPIGVMGFLSFGITAFAFLRMSKITEIALVIAASIPLALWFVGRIWGWQYLEILLPENLLIDKVHQDTLFHVAISQMAKTYGVPSTGLDGLPQIQYHVASHWLLGQLSLLLSIPVLQIYTLGYPVIFLPLLIRSLLSFAVQLRAYMAEDQAPSPIRRDILFWLVLILLSLEIYPIYLQREIINSDIAFGPISESQGMGLIVLFILLNIVLVYLSTTKREHRHSLSSYVFLLGVVPLLFAISGYTKISIAALLLLLIIYGHIKLRLYRDMIFNLSFAAIVMTFAALQVFNGENQNNPSLSIFSHFTDYIQPQWIPLWLVLYFLGMWLFVGLQLYAKGIRTIEDLMLAFFENKLLDIEMLVLLSASGAGVVLLLNISTSALYFSDVQRWVATSLLLGNLAFIRRKFRFSTAASTPMIWRKLRIQSILQGSILCVLGFAALQNAYLAFEQMTISNWTARQLLTEQSSVDRGRFNETLDDFDIVHAYQLLQANADLVRVEYPRYLENHAAKNAMLETLIALDDLPLSEKRKSVLFIPQTNATYWGLSDDCDKVPFIAPALSGIAMLDHLPVEGCRAITYGYNDYTLRSGPQSLNPNDTDQLCQRARSMGFSRVIVLLNTTDDGSIERRDLSCPE